MFFNVINCFMFHNNNNKHIYVLLYLTNCMEYNFLTDVPISRANCILFLGQYFGMNLFFILHWCDY